MLERKGTNPCAAPRVFLSDESGASAVEYALILAIITLAIGTAAALLGGAISNGIDNTASYMVFPASS